jgi:hypothetical protein
VTINAVRPKKIFLGKTGLQTAKREATLEVVSPLKRQKLVAVAGADGNLVTALGTTAAENSCTGLGLHAAEKTMGFGAAAAVGLKSTLGHGTELLKRQETSCRNFFAIAAISDCTLTGPVFHRNV